jgi:hypothetical protein
MKTTTEQKEALEQLREWLPRGQRVYTILRHVSASGMTRDISLVVFKEGQEWPLHPNYTVAKAMGWRLVETKGSKAIRVSGCGMDMGFHLVHSISQKLYGWNEDGSYNAEGAYALKQEWL